MKILLKTFVATALCALDVFAGPYADDMGGIHITSTVFRGWIAGYSDYTHPSNSGGYAADNDYASTSVSNAIIGQPYGYAEDAGDNTAHVLSLGNGGSIILTFDSAIYDGPGNDFAVFENGFTDGTPRGGDTNVYTFAELAFVEVGTTTSAWARFPSIYLGTSYVYNLNYTASNRYASQDVTLIDGLAGKFMIEYGTPFDLSTLVTNSAVTNGSVDLSNINYIRLIDVIGDGSTLDSSNQPIYDPYYHYQLGYPNAANPSVMDGFDLRAIGVINYADISTAVSASPGITWYAPTNTYFQIQYSDAIDSTNWSDLGDPILGNSATNTISDTNTFSGCRIYRMIRWSAEAE